jgi:hypothetical protein
MEVSATGFGGSVFQALLGAGRRAGRKGTGPVTSTAVLAHLARWPAPDEAPVVNQVRLALRTDGGWPPAPEPAGTSAHVGADRVSAVLREARWRLAERQPVDRPVVGWHPSVAAALTATIAEARSAGVDRAGPNHLMVGLLGTGDEQAPFAASLRADPSWRQPGEPHVPLVNRLDITEELDERNGRLLAWLGRQLRRGRARRTRFGGTLAPNLLDEAARQAVRAGNGTVTPAHLVLAVASLRAQLDASGRSLRAAVVPWNAAVETLGRHGVTLERGAAALAPDPRQPIRPEWTSEAEAAVERSVALAAAAGDPEVGSSHLTIAALEHEAAAALLATIGADPAAVRAELETGMGRGSSGR